MKKLIVALTLLLTLASAFADFTPTIVLSQDTSQYSYGNGGEFRAVSPQLGTFQTFCVEPLEYFSPGSTYNFRINTGAVNGGTGANAIDPYTGGPMDNISIGTAWLYNQFARGILVGYDYTYGSGRTLSANNLQQSIWWLENETNIRPQNSYVDIVESALYLSDTLIRNDSEGEYNVSVLNLFDANGKKVQDQLYTTKYTIPVPEPSQVACGILLTLGIGYYMLRRNKTNTVNR